MGLGRKKACTCMPCVGNECLVQPAHAQAKLGIRFPYMIPHMILDFVASWVTGYCSAEYIDEQKR